jgi:mRNA interferase MazF
MSAGTGYEFGDVVLAPFPFAQEPGQSKQRPVIVVSNSAYNLGTSDLVCCGITSVLTNTGFHILITQKDMESGAMPWDSLIKYGYVYTLQRSLVMKKVGRVDGRIRRQIVKAMAELFNGT